MVALEGHHTTQWLLLSHSMIASSIFVSRLLLGDGSFREELSRPWAQPRVRWIPVGDPPTRQRERVLVGQHHQQEMEEDDDSTPEPR
jgi:hypothetical protein